MIVSSCDEFDSEVLEVVEEMLVDDNGIVEAVMQEIGEGLGNDEEQGPGPEPESTNDVQVNWADLPYFCTQLEAACMGHLEKSFCAQLLDNLRQFRGLIRTEMQNSESETLDSGSIV